MLTAANSAATTNGFNSTTDNLTLNTPPTSGPNQNANSAEVIVTRTEPRYFTQMFDNSTVTLTARAVATFTSASNACILALDPSAAQSVYFSGSSTVNLVGCNVMTNSLSASSIYSQGSTNVSVPCLMTVGGVSINQYVTETSCSAPMTQLAKAGDPFRNLVEPAVTGACASSSGSTLSPGRYCGGLSLSGTKTLSPGTYIIDGGTLKSNGNANITGAGVTFFLANNATLSLNGNSNLNLSAPTSGAFSGVLFFGSRSNLSTTTQTLNGSSTLTMTGAIYFPTQIVSYIGNFSGANGCTQIVARIIQWSGSANLAANCSAYGMNPMPVGGVVRLAE
jgi:hypothetical protein